MRSVVSAMMHISGGSYNHKQHTRSCNFCLYTYSSASTLPSTSYSMLQLEYLVNMHLQSKSVCHARTLCQTTEAAQTCHTSVGR